MMAYTMEENDWLSSNQKEDKMEKSFETLTNLSKAYFEGLFDFTVKATQDVVKFNQELAQEFAKFNNAKALEVAKVMKYPVTK